METILIVAVAFLTIGFVGLVARYATDHKKFNETFNDVYGGLNDDKQGLYDKINVLEKYMSGYIACVRKECLLASYKPKFKYGDMVRTSPVKLFGWGAEDIKAREGRVLSVEYEYINETVYEILTIDTGTESFISRGNNCTLI